MALQPAPGALAFFLDPGRGRRAPARAGVDHWPLRPLREDPLRLLLQRQPGRLEPAGALSLLAPRGLGPMPQVRSVVTKSTKFTKWGAQVNENTEAEIAKPPRAERRGACSRSTWRRTRRERSGPRDGAGIGGDRGARSPRFLFPAGLVVGRDGVVATWGNWEKVVAAARAATGRQEGAPRPLHLLPLRYLQTSPASVPGGLPPFLSA